jgi:signal transduction histidine kinase
LTAAGQKAVEICLLQASRQKALIQQILDVFAAEVGAFETAAHDPAHAPDMVWCAQAVVEALRPSCVRNQVTLQLAPDIDVAAEWRVVGEASRLERVIFNLVDNALRHSPVGSAVTVDIAADEVGVFVTVDDEGPGVPPDLMGTMFEKFSQARVQPGQAGLGLYFCRITIEGWGGTIGYSPRATGGARFWFRLPRPAAV